MSTCYTRAITLRQEYWFAIFEEAKRSRMREDQIISHAIRLMQRDAIMSRKGLTMAYVDSNGQIVRDEPIGLPDIH